MAQRTDGTGNEGSQFMKLEKPKVVLNRCAAFSLIELMAVIFIIALLAAIGVA
ncbi:MAG: prepilin-type N-terminal cleavage/methylation domain-containing protein, partial [Pedosphaera sp.]|nr:prepilin-type N-terminal cleavage/methylation domain-containing protein [Pedosphaera sp.]